MYWIVIVVCLMMGALFGNTLPIMSFDLTKYMSIAVLAALDSLFGGIRAFYEDSFDNVVFITGFVVNVILGAGLAYLGDLMRVEFYLAAVVVFGSRIFQNIAITRRYILKKHLKSSI